MKEIIKNLYIGNADDYEQYVKGKDDWSIVHACKEPYHRKALGAALRFINFVNAWYVRRKIWLITK